MTNIFAGKKSVKKKDVSLFFANWDEGVHESGTTKLFLKR